MSETKKESVWAVEPGYQVQFERLENERVKITIWEDYGNLNQTVKFEVTIENWRFHKLVNAVSLNKKPREFWLSKWSLDNSDLLSGMIHTRFTSMSEPDMEYVHVCEVIDGADEKDEIIAKITYDVIDLKRLNAGNNDRILMLEKLLEREKQNVSYLEDSSARTAKVRWEKDAEITRLRGRIDEMELYQNELKKIIKAQFEMADK